MPEFKGFPKIPRLEKFLSGMIVTEKIDGTNACVVIEQYDATGEGNPPELIIAWDDQDGVTWGMFAQSRKRMLCLGDDNYGFCRWVADHCEELKTLGHGHHFGEWWGNGIQRNYGQDQKRLSLFNVNRPVETLPECCDQVPVLYKGEFSKAMADTVLTSLILEGSKAAPGFMEPEGIMLYLPGVRQYVKHPIEKQHKSAAATASFVTQAQYAADHPLPEITEDDLPEGTTVTRDQDVTIINLPEGIIMDIDSEGRMEPAS